MGWYPGSGRGAGGGGHGVLLGKAPFSGQPPCISGAALSQGLGAALSWGLAHVSHRIRADTRTPEQARKVDQGMWVLLQDPEDVWGHGGPWHPGPFLFEDPALEELLVMGNPTLGLGSAPEGPVPLHTHTQGRGATHTSGMAAEGAGSTWGQRT